jgi:RAP1 GTPase activating protein 1
LDVTNNTTGLESIYENYEGTEIMFHVSTFLAHLEKKPDFVERKRHIGNDRVAIVFQDRDTIFTPKSFPSTQIRVFMIIQPVTIDNETKRYKVIIDLLQ